MSLLVLLRHGESQFNLENRFTGWLDVPLSPKGILEAKEAGEKIKKQNIHFDKAYVSNLKRAQDSLEHVLEILKERIPIESTDALNERHYGDLQGLDKSETAKKFGEKQVKIWRRSYDVAPPNGESLKDTAERTLPYFDSKIRSDLRREQNVLVLAHGNSLRCIIMSLDRLTKEQVMELNIPTGVPIVYEFDPTLNIIRKKEL